MRRDLAPPPEPERARASWCLPPQERIFISIHVAVVFVAHVSINARKLNERRRSVMGNLSSYLYYEDELTKIYLADCRDVLPQLEPVDLVLKNSENLALSVLQSEHENHQTRRIQANTGSGEMGEIAARNRMALPFSELVTGQDCSVFQGFTDSHEQGLKEAEDQITRARTAGRTERAIQGRVTEHLLPSDDSERQMLEMRRDGKPCNSSQEFQSSGQSLGKSSGSLRQLPQSASQDGMVATPQIICITDCPYGVTRNGWDSLDWVSEFWLQMRRLKVGAVITTAQQPFTSEMVMAGRDWFKWADVWHKTQARGHLNANVMPLREHEDILVFAPGAVTYHPQFSQKPSFNVRPETARTKGTSNYGKHGLKSKRTVDLQVSYPRSVVRFENSQEGQHPTQKPLALFAYLLRTFTNPVDVILDPFAGSGTTLVAAKQLGLKAIGIEIEEKYCRIAVERLRQRVFNFAEVANA